jgi:hypothetical protein
MSLSCKTFCRLQPCGRRFAGPPLPVDRRDLWVCKLREGDILRAMSSEQFISEPVSPIAGMADTAAMARGEPGLAQTSLPLGEMARRAREGS